MAKVNINTIKSWFRTGLKPTQQQFYSTWDSFWHKDEKIPAQSIENLDTYLNEKADNEALQNHINNKEVHLDNIKDLIIPASENVTIDGQGTKIDPLRIDAIVPSSGIVPNPNGSSTKFFNELGEVVDISLFESTIKNYQVNETFTDDLSNIYRFYNGNIYQYIGTFPFATVSIEDEILITPTNDEIRWKILVYTQKPLITLVTPLTVQRNALLTLVVKSNYLDETSKCVIDGITNLTEVLDISNNSIVITFTSPNILGQHNITVNNKAGFAIYNKKLNVANDLEITPLTADWTKIGIHQNELTIQDNKLFPNVEIYRSPNTRSALFTKEILGVSHIKAGQNFELHVDGFTPTGYVLSPNNDIGVKEIGTEINGVENGYIIRHGGNDSTQIYENGRAKGIFYLAKESVCVLKRVNGVFSWYEYNGVTMTLLVVSTTSNNNAMEVFFDSTRIGGVKNIKLIYNV